jgi:hypothetical protein
MVKKSIFLAGLFVAFLCIAGCQKTVIVGPDMQTQAVYAWGSLKATEDKNIVVVNAAALKAMDDLSLAVTMKTADALSAQIIAHDSMDSKIAVYLTAAAENSTKLVVHVGVGNEDRAKIIYKQIRTNLNLKK